MKRFFAICIACTTLFSLPACTADASVKTESAIDDATSEDTAAEDTTTNTNDFAAQAEEGMQHVKEITLSSSFGDLKGKYSGEMKEGVPHGKGKFVSQNQNESGWFYEGMFENGHFSGQGKTVFQNGQVQEGLYVNDIWQPNTLQFFSFLQTLPGSAFSINDKAKAVFSGEKNYFPVSTQEELSAVTDTSITYADIVEAPTYYGDTFMKVSDLSVTLYSTFSVTENPDNQPELRGAYIEASTETGENYAIHYRGNIEDLRDTSVLKTVIGLPLGTMQKADASGEEKTYVVLAAGYVELEPLEEE